MERKSVFGNLILAASLVVAVPAAAHAQKVEVGASLANITHEFGDEGTSAVGIPSGGSAC